MEARGRADKIWPLLEDEAALELRIFEILDGSKVLVDQRGVGQQPEALGRLQFGGVRGQEMQMDMVGQAQLEAGMPAGAIEHEPDLLAGTGTGPDLARKRCRFHLKEGNIDGRCQMEERASGGGVDEADEIAPLKAMLDSGDGALANRPQMRRRSGLRPMRCSSVAHSSTWACGNAAATACSSGFLFFEGLLLCGVDQGMARARRLETVLEALQIIPAGLGR